ncbi:MAG TPA: hypothetical protein VF516_36210 [Kofleriaceae bacterium]
MPQLTTRPRGDLKTFFAKNAIPTESNFADLIDGMLNQQDDGIAKLPNDALMIVAAGDATSQKKALHFYYAAADTDPSWTLSLNPRQNPAAANTANLGFSISDGAGNSRLFIERSTGRIGVGTVGPLQAALHIDRGATNDLALLLSSSGPGWGSGLQLKNTAAGAAHTYGIYTGGGTLHFADVDASADRMAILGDGTVWVPGKVTIGVSTPVSDLTLRRDATAALGPIITLYNMAGAAGAGGAIDFNGYNVGANPPTARIQSLDDGIFSSHVVISTKNSGAVANPLVERMRISSGGIVSFTGAIMPSAGNSSVRGIQFPSNPGGGGGDEAFIRYYPVSGETCKLLIGINNDADDTIGLYQAGAERLTVGYGYVDVVADGNPIRFTSFWTGFADSATNRAEISNDTGGYKTLMIVGNKSAGHERRVGVWDRLDVNGSFWVNGAQKFDLAEVTPARADDQLEQGDVVVIDREDGLRVRRSARPHDPAVYGVVSSYAQAAMVIGGSGDPDEMTQAPDRRPIALVGRVKIKVCSETGPIRAGDLLTTSSRPGHAMRCADPAAHPGAIAGKALEPFSGDTGTITALVTLQ